MIFEQILIGGDRNYSYLVGDKKGGECAVVDPSYDPGRMVKLAKKHDLKIRYVFVTHDHPDHTSGIESISKSTGAEIASFSGSHGKKVKDGEVLKAGALEFRIIHTPGHTPDSICLLAGGKLMTGDTLFVGKVGGTDYFGGDAQDEYDSLHKKLMTLPEETEVWPGHNYGVKPCSTIGNEKKTNPFLLRKTFEDFIDLKENWAEYKLKHGIK
jgi:glyoxylase-like metal-dependent hydrolase (beta-lactamase superfamily II)